MLLLLNTQALLYRGILPQRVLAPLLERHTLTVVVVAQPQEVQVYHVTKESLRVRPDTPYHQLQQQQQQPQIGAQR
jgi:hypothetical protein